MEKEAVLAAAIALLVSIIVPLISNPSSLATGTVGLAILGNATNITLLLNGADGDISIVSGSTVNITAFLNISGMTVFLDTDVSGWIIQNGTTPLMQYITLVTPGTYTITAWFPADPNYTSSNSTHLITVTAAPVPPITPPGPSTGGGAGPWGPTNVTPRPNPKLEVMVIDDRTVLLNGTNMVIGQYFAETSGARELSMTTLSFMLTQDKQQLKIIIERVPKPDVAPSIEEQHPSAVPYAYLRVTVIGADPQAAFNITSMAFRVERSWILSQAINESTMMLYSFWNQWLPVTAAVAGPAYEYQNGWIPTNTFKTGQDAQYSTFVSANMRGLTTYYAVAGERLPGPFQLFILPTYVGPYYMQLIIVLLSIALMLLYAERKGGPKARAEIKEGLHSQIETLDIFGKRRRQRQRKR